MTSAAVPAAGQPVRSRSARRSRWCSQPCWCVSGRCPGGGSHPCGWGVVEIVASVLVLVSVVLS